MEYGKNKITKSAITNAKDFEQLADSETSTIMLNLYSKLKAFDFFKDISGIIGDVDEPNYSDDDYDFSDIAIIIWTILNFKSIFDKCFFIL